MLLGKRIPARLIIIGLLLIASLGMAVYLGTMSSSRGIPFDLQGVLRPAPKPLQPFNLIDQAGQPFTLERLQDKWTMVFFGYTYCPDICPTTLAMMAEVYKRLDREPGVVPDTQVVFISVDPDRDGPGKLAEYVAYFDKRFSASTGKREEIDGLANQFGAGYRIEPSDSSDNYLISHTGSIFLVDPEARLQGSFSPPHDPKTIAAQYLRIRTL